MNDLIHLLQSQMIKCLQTIDYKPQGTALDHATLQMTCPIRIHGIPLDLHWRLARPDRQAVACYPHEAFFKYHAR